MPRNAAKPRHLRPFGWSTKVDNRKALILDVLRKSVTPLTRLEITAALDWPESILTGNTNTGIDPLTLLIEEGKVGKIKEHPHYKYYSDPDISKMITKLV